MNAQPISSLVTQLVQATRSRVRQPSQRNLEIFEEVRVKGKSQLEVGAFRGLSQRRVSAICQQVARWRGEHEPAELGEPQGAARVRSERWLTRRRLEEVYTWSLRGLATSGETRRTTVTHMRGDETNRRVLTGKEQNFNVQWVKVARATINDLHELAELDEPEAPPPTKPGLRQVQADRIVRLVACLRRTVRQASQAASPDCLRQVVEQIVQAIASQGSSASPLLDQPAVAPSSSSSAPPLEEPAVAPASPLMTPEPERANYSTFPTETVVEVTGVASADSVASRSPADACSAPLPIEATRQNSSGRVEKSVARTVSRGAHERHPSHRCDDEARAAQAQVEYCFAVAMSPEEIAAELKELRAIQAGRYRMFEFTRQQAEALERWDRAPKERGASTAAK